MAKNTEKDREKLSKKRYSIFDFHQIPFSQRTTSGKHKVRSLPLSQKFPPGTGTIYSWQFGIMPPGSESFQENNGARLTYIGLSFQNPTMDRIDQHKEGTKSSDTRLDYLAFSAAVLNERPDAQKLNYSDMVDVIDIVSIFDLTLMEIYYIKDLYKTQRQYGGGAGYSSFDEYLKNNNAYSRGTKIKLNVDTLGLNTGPGGEGGPLNKDIFRGDSESAIITFEDLVFGALYFLEDKSPTVLKARDMYYGNGWKPDNDKIVKMFSDFFDSKNKKQLLEDSKVKLAFSVLYVLHWFKERGYIDAKDITVNPSDEAVRNILKGSLASVPQLSIGYVTNVLNNLDYKYKESDNPYGYASTPDTPDKSESSKKIKDKFGNVKAGQVLAMIYTAGSSNPVTKKSAAQAILSSLSTTSAEEVLDIVISLTAPPDNVKKVDEIKKWQKAQLDKKKPLLDDIYGNMLVNNLEQISSSFSYDNKQVSAVIDRSKARLRQTIKLQKRGMNMVMFYQPIKEIIDDLINKLESLGIVLAEDEKEFLQAKGQASAYLVVNDYRKG